MTLAGWSSLQGTRWWRTACPFERGLARLVEPDLPTPVAFMDTEQDLLCVDWARTKRCALSILPWLVPSVSAGYYRAVSLRRMASDKVYLIYLVLRHIPSLAQPPTLLSLGPLPRLLSASQSCPVYIKADFACGTTRDGREGGWSRLGGGPGSRSRRLLMRVAEGVWSPPSHFGPCSGRVSA